MQKLDQNFHIFNWFLYEFFLLILKPMVVSIENCSYKIALILTKFNSRNKNYRSDPVKYILTNVIHTRRAHINNDIYIYFINWWR